MRKLAISAPAFFFIFFCLITQSHAAAEWYDGTVVQAGVINAQLPTTYKMQMKVRITTPGFYYNIVQTCYAPEGREKEMLALALTAMVNERRIRILFDPAVSVPVIRSLIMR